MTRYSIEIGKMTGKNRLQSEVFDKKTKKTPQFVIDNCKRRLRAYDEAAKEDA